MDINTLGNLRTQYEQAKRQRVLTEKKLTQWEREERACFEALREHETGIGKGDIVEYRGTRGKFEHWEIDGLDRDVGYFKDLDKHQLQAVKSPEELVLLHKNSVGTGQADR